MRLNKRPCAAVRDVRMFEVVRYSSIVPECTLFCRFVLSISVATCTCCKQSFSKKLLKNNVELVRICKIVTSKVFYILHFLSYFLHIPNRCRVYHWCKSGT